jgi:hypothetical protein
VVKVMMKRMGAAEEGMRMQGLETKIQDAEEGMRKQGGGHVRRHQKRGAGQVNSRSKSHKLNLTVLSWILVLEKWQ